MTQAERIMALEVRMASLERTSYAIDTKLDALLALKNKGAGAFWLASALFGTTIIGTITMMLDYLRSL